MCGEILEYLDILVIHWNFDKVVHHSKDIIEHVFVPLCSVLIHILYGLNNACLAKDFTGDDLALGDEICDAFKDHVQSLDISATLLHFLC